MSLQVQQGVYTLSSYSGEARPGDWNARQQNKTVEMGPQGLKRSATSIADGKLYAVRGEAGEVLTSFEVDCLRPSDAAGALYPVP